MGMFHIQLVRIRRHRSSLIAGLLTLALLPLAPGSTPMRAAGEKDKDHGKPSPCDRLIDVPGEAKGLHKRCDELGGGSGVARGDFNGDNIGDLAIGVPYENVGTANNAGAVNIIYGSATGLTATGNQFFTQDTPGVAGVAEKDDHFGLTLAAVDFNHDGFSDLAVGVPHEDEGFDNEGIVQMFMGSATGLTPGQLFDFNTLEGGRCNCEFGSALAWGDFDNDSLPDLAIGMRKYDFDGKRSGGVIIRFGNGVDHLIANPQSTGEDSFGMALAAGDHDGNGYDDLAVGAPFADSASRCTIFVLCTNGASDSGRVFVFMGSAGGLGNVKTLAAIRGPGEGDEFGRSLAFGDFDRDGRDDLAVGSPFEDVYECYCDPTQDAGSVQIFYGLQLFPIRTNRIITQSDLSGSPTESLDQFGFSLAAADFDGDGHVDLAIGVPGEDFSNPYDLLNFRQDGGVVNVLYGYEQLGLPVNGRNEMWHQDVSGVPGGVEAGDRFGYSLSAWNFGNGSQKDLAIGVPYEDVGSKVDAGAVVVLYGKSTGLGTVGAQIWDQDSPGIVDVASTDDRFGASMY